MIVYNITIKVSHNIVDEWIAWQKHEHIPETMATKMFDDYKMYHIFEHDDEEGATFAIQYFTSSIERYEQYTSLFAPMLREKSVAKWGSQFTAFRTIMQTVL
ncbi:MAG: DUF4286 family protein [Bacteroidetes bacterium]|nr:DUF4286 family protein [Bacteroidota bacterium]MBS1974153.1 DUF4286 family protein [Bacteroidota bacterium]